jgi:hypothetical protein
MTSDFLTGCWRRAKIVCSAVALTVIAAAAAGQTPTPEQLNVLRSLPQDQQDSLIQSVLGKSDGTNRKSDPRLNMPETVDEKNDRSRGQRGDIDQDKTIDGRVLRRSREDPELRAYDSVLIDLTPYELTPKDTIPRCRLRVPMRRRPQHPAR